MSKRRVKTPATALYDYWLMVLKGSGLPVYNRITGSINFGQDDYYGIGTVDGGTDAHPNIGFGYVRWSMTPKFVVTYHGDFQLGAMHGWKQRDAVERNTFLSWYHDFRSYNWTASPHPNARTYGHLGDHRTQMPYTPESAMSLSYNCTDQGAWMCLEEQQDGWHIVPSPRRVWPQADDMAQRFEHAERLRHKRYRRSELADQRAQGILPPLKPGLSPEEREERRAANREAAINVILAGFDVSKPAVSTPLRRDREEGLWPVRPGSR